MLCLRAVQADPVPVTAPGQERAATGVLETAVLISERQVGWVSSAFSGRCVMVSTIEVFTQGGVDDAEEEPTVFDAQTTQVGPGQDSRTLSCLWRSARASVAGRSRPPCPSRRTAHRGQLPACVLDL